MKSCWLCMALWMTVAMPGFAQDFAVGTRLRVTRADGKSITGQLAALDERNLTIEQWDASGIPKQVVLSREDTRSIQISKAPSRKGRGAGIGFLAGAAAGALLGAAGGSGGDCQNALAPCLSRSATVTALAVLLGGLGAGIGAAASHGEKWETVGPAQVNVSVIPVRRGAGIAVAARF